ncbi:hypothetical protein D6C79_00468 [Aureobasidium pullulans]|nr:hypothetical protein D6C79_00468 [Aureobasidium pullulans]
MGDHSATKPIRMYSRWGVAMDMFTLFYLSLFFSRASKIGALFFFCSSFLSMVLSDASVTKVLSQCVDKKSSIQYTVDRYSQDSVQPMADWMRFALHPQ